MKILINLFFLLLPCSVLAQIYSFVPHTPKDWNVNLLRDTTTYDQYGNLHYEVRIDESTQTGVYFAYYSRKKKKKRAKLMTKTWYEIKNDTTQYTKGKLYNKDRELIAMVDWSKKCDAVHVKYYWGSIRWEFSQTWPDRESFGIYREYRGKQIWVDGQYKKGFRAGRWKEYHRNGELMMEGKFEAAFKYRHTISHTGGWRISIIDHNLDTLIQYVSSNHWSGPTEKDSLRKYELMSNGIANRWDWNYSNRHGKWKHYSTTGKLYLIEKWEHGHCQDSTFIDTLK